VAMAMAMAVRGRFLVGIGDIHHLVAISRGWVRTHYMIDMLCITTNDISKG
jgi:hypothetical protein